MPTHEERAERHNELLRLLAQLEATRTDDLRRLDLSRDLNFDLATPYIEETWRIYRNLSRVSLDRAPHTLLNQLIGVAQQTQNLFQSIKAFRPDTLGANARPQRDAWVQQLRDSYDNVFEQVMRARAFLAEDRPDSTQTEEDARRVLARVDALFEQNQQTLDAKVVEAERALESVRRSAAEAGVSQSAIYFKGEADEHQRSSGWWLLTTGVLAILTVAFGIASFFYQVGLAPDPKPWLAVQLTISKFIVFSILASAVVFSGRVYRAHRHNYVVNKHRQNALSTFQLFAQAAEDYQTKSAVLLQATQSIFSVQDSGYRSGDGDAPSSPQVLEIFRGAGTGAH